MKLNGWILDLCPCREGMALWLIEANGKHHRLIDRSFRPCFYVQGHETRLSRLAQAIEARFPAHCALKERASIWDGQPLRVLQVTVYHLLLFSTLARFVRRFDASLRLYNSDLMLASVYCWEKGIFPLGRVSAEVNDAGKISSLACDDDEWSTTYDLPPLRIMQIRLEGLSRVNPKHGRQGAIEIAIDGEWRVLEDADEPVVESFERLLRTHDPDIILSEWGDAVLFPLLFRQAAKRDICLSLNRDQAPVQHSAARTYMSYGRILFKESASTLFGRLHIDTQNSFIAGQCELDGLWELARVTKLPIQYAARTTTGTGISYMQMELAYKDGTLIPEQKAEPENPKHPDELLAADRGGLVFAPRPGFFENVAELDFISEYPTIMATFNISPETVNCGCCPDGPRIPELGYRVCQRRRGITSRVVERLIQKRQLYKQQARDHDAEEYKLRRDALKWLLVCCFGYTGYKNARFGKIEAHEAINAMAREQLLVAKETAEGSGYRVLHALVDSLYVQKLEATGEDYERLARQIEAKTNLPLAVEAVYRYVVFLPSKQDAEIPVPNRFFAVSQSGEIKIRGLECRRHDTPPLVARMQREVLAVLAEAWDFESYCAKLDEAREVCEQYLARLIECSVAPEELVISRRLTRSPKDYQKNNLTAIVARQLDRAGVQVRPGENIQFIITDVHSKLLDDRVRAWTLWEAWRGYDDEAYQEALEKAFQPFTHFAHSLALTTASPSLSKRFESFAASIPPILS
ncbi:MAG TPA: DNA polymerase domain-containing protein [Terriglobia bacterium]|nr:DNA polymerase domain-containing protein [Terriglobia bacterium]